MGFSRLEYWNGSPFPFPGDLPNPGIEPRSPALEEDSLPAEPQGKLKKTGMSCLSLLQGIFLTQESNWGLLHCRWILYQLSYEGSPLGSKMTFYSKLQREMSVFSSVWEWFIDSIIGLCCGWPQNQHHVSVFCCLSASMWINFHNIEESTYLTHNLTT